MPKRIQRRRVKGWRMPPNTVTVDRMTRWGNPFVVGKHGTRAECVDLFRKMLAGYICVSTGNATEQMAYLKMASRDRGRLKGKDLACWCALSSPCHADVLLELANADDKKL